MDAATLDQTAEELAAFHEESAESEAGVDSDEREDYESVYADSTTGEDSERSGSEETTTDTDTGDETDDDADEDAPAGFWTEVGIDPIKIVTSEREHFTLRCYLDDEPIFLGSNGRIETFPSERALARALAEPGDLARTDLADVSTWDEVLTSATAGELEIDVDPDNTYVLAGLADDIGDGLDAIDPTQLELAVELLTDTADWAGDDSVHDALASSERLGWLVSFVLNPDPTRLSPSAPFDAEQKAWHTLVENFETRLHLN